MDAKQLFESRIFSVERLTYETPSGAKMQRDVVRHPGAVAIVPILDGGQICLIKNRRVSVDQTLIEIPAGTMEPPEPPLDCAHRELIEETGYRAGKLELLHTFYTAPGILDEKMHLYKATDLEAGDAAREEYEQIENFVTTIAEAKRMVEAGEIVDAKTMVAILLL